MRWIVFLILVVTTARAEACGVDTDCQLGDRSYRIYLPKHTDAKPMPAIIFVHGWRGTAAGIIADKSLLALADELGVALVAPQSVGNGWRLPGRPRQRDNTGKEEFDYFHRLVDDIVQRYNIDRRELLVSGFSGGAMMTWNLACHEGGMFAGFAPISGTFWAPIPKGCPSKPVNLIHFHGTSDNVVPLSGRAIADSKQGDVHQALELFEKSGNFGPLEPVPAEGMKCECSENPTGKILEFCTHPGGHMYKAEFVRRAWKTFHIAGK